jgi:hypothetical protein
MSGTGAGGFPTLHRSTPPANRRPAIELENDTRSPGDANTHGRSTSNPVRDQKPFTDATSGLERAERFYSLPGGAVGESCQPSELCELIVMSSTTPVSVFQAAPEMGQRHLSLTSTRSSVALDARAESTRRPTPPPVLSFDPQWGQYLIMIPPPPASGAIMMNQLRKRGHHSYRIS